MNETRDSSPTTTEKTAKKRYSPPRLVVYGAVIDLTRASVNGGGKNDNAHGPWKTH